ncbi:MAG: translation initiation factor IF-2 [Clostridia bacterium]|nr:translation initiation factor IF-2 [Clostridia bacterium]
MLQKIRVHEVAKDFKLKSTDLLDLLKGYGIELKNHMATLDEMQLSLIFEYYTQKHAISDDTDLEKLFGELWPSAQPEEKVADKKEEKDVKAAEEKPVEDKPIERKMRHIDTRQTVVDLDKLDTERIEELVPENVKTMQQSSGKQKIKKAAQRQKDNKFNQNKMKAPVKPQVVKPQELKVSIPDEISVGELANRMHKPAAEIVKKLMILGIMASVSQLIDYDTASLVAEELGAKVEHEIVLSDEDILLQEFEIEDKEEDLEPRSPVVVVMGHVDHGKTSLLDAIRESNVAAGEAGGITQHIGAHRVRINDRDITFLDTPGHEAFTAMRARGALVTDIAILVVAADDGVMPQTIEAINHAKAANVSIIVAVNKIDKEGANPDRIKQEMTEYGLVPEEWGGDTIFVNVSAKQRTNIDGLLEMVLLTADIQELKANPNRRATGTVIEARLDRSRGPIATVLVQNGTLKSGDILVAGTAVGRVRAMMDDKGKQLKSAGPSIPVEILGLSETPDGGDVFYAVEDERRAKAVVENRRFKAKEEQFNARQVVSLDNLFDQINDGNMKELNVIIKADVQGSVEAVRQSLEKLSNDEVRVRTIHGGVGAVNESDVMLAAASNAIIVGFNVRPDTVARGAYERGDVDIRLYRVIYDAIEEIEAALKGMLDPKFKEALLGHAEVRQVFKVSGVGAIAGSYVTDGKILRNAQVRVVRDGVVFHEGVLNSLKRFKDDAKEVMSGYECGIGIEKFNDIKEGDVIECFIMEEIKQ